MSAAATTPAVVVVGAGPAGIAAATMLLQQGARVTLIDEMPAIGGQYYKQRSAARNISRGRDLDERVEKGQDRLAALHGDRFDMLTGTLAWGLFQPSQVAILRDNKAEILTPDAVVLAGGAMERAAAFPGWTLPGVVMAGGVQSLLSKDAVLPGRRQRQRQPVHATADVHRQRRRRDPQGGALPDQARRSADQGVLLRRRHVAHRRGGRATLFGRGTPRHRR